MSNNISLSLSIIFSKCLSSEKFPMSYKKSVVILFSKNTNIKNCTNNRQITLNVNNIFKNVLK